MDDPAALSAMTSIAALARLLPERDPHPNLFEVTLFVLGFLDDVHVWPALLVRWELVLLEELGFGLDLATCAATGSSEDLVYVSPKSGRAVSAGPASRTRTACWLSRPSCAASRRETSPARTWRPASRSPGIFWRLACCVRASWRCRRPAPASCLIFVGMLEFT